MDEVREPIWRVLFDPRGQLSRLQYILVALFSPLLFAMVIIAFPSAVGVAFLALYYVLLTATIRRLHDCGRSGWMALLTIVPIANFILGLYLLVTPGETHWPNSDEVSSA